MVLEFMQYSEGLVEECKKVFKEENNLDLSSETANEYLESMSRLFTAFSKSPSIQKSVAEAEKQPTD